MRYLTLLLLVWFAPLLSAEETTEGNEKGFFSSSSILEGQTYNYWEDFVNMLLSLLFILGLVILSVWFLKKIMRSRLKNLNRSTGIKILERRALNSKASLYLVDILGKGVVIAESQAGIQLITEFEAEENVESMLSEVQESEPPRLSFKETLQQTLKRFTRRDESC